MDLIDRQEAATIPVTPKRYRKYQTMNLDDAYEQGWEDLQKCIEKLPSAQPERKKGKWIEVRIMPKAFDITGDETWASVMQCDKCGFEMFAVERHMAQYNFCPSCGAEMKGDNNG